MLPLQGDCAWLYQIPVPYRPRLAKSAAGNIKPAEMSSAELNDFAEEYRTAVGSGGQLTCPQGDV